MSVLTVPPKPEVFSTVPHLNDAITEFNDRSVATLISSLGHVFAKHKVYNDFGLGMIHRHFEMSGKDEILVETIDEERTKSVAVPWKIDGLSAVPVQEEVWTSHGLSERKFIVPQNWFFNSAGELVPFEFLAVDDQATCPLPPEEFTNELFSVLKSHGVDKVLGLRRTTFIRDINTWETTPNGMRANVTVFGKIPKEEMKGCMIQVAWHFDAEGRLRKKGAWCGNCCNHCNHCDHCGSHTY